MLAEESMNLASSSVTDLVDNVGMLLLDLVWACFKLGDVRRLAGGWVSRAGRGNGNCMSLVRSRYV